MLGHNEAQDGKGELDAGFWYFKQQLQKWIRRFKTAVLTPSHMVEAMRYSTGVRNFRLDVVELNRSYLDDLFDNNRSYYGGQVKKRMSQVLPSNIAEIRTNENGLSTIYTSSALPPFEFKNGTVKMLDKYMETNMGEFKMGYNFFAFLPREIAQRIMFWSWMTYRKYRTEKV